MIQHEILNHLNDPGKLEKLYRADKTLFKRTFSALYPEVEGNGLADFWNERLNYESDEINWGTGRELLMVIVASLVAGLLAKLPVVLPVSEEFFYTRNIGFIVFPLLTVYFAWKNKFSTGKFAVIAGLTLAGLIFINTFPDVKTSDTLTLSCIHLALFLWSVLGFAFVGGKKDSDGKRLEFLKYNGDLVVMAALIVIAGGIMSAITVGLFSLIGLNIGEFYFKYIGILGLAAVPVVATYLIRTNPQLVGRVSPVIAKLFGPLVLVMLIVYLTAIVYSGKDPYNDREFLLMFNALLVGVMAIIFFSVAETAKTAKSSAGVWVLFLLSVVTIIVNGVALSAILFRISEWGFTPNRAAVLGSNILVLINLLLITLQLFRVLSKKAELAKVGEAISFYLPVYFVWTIIVTFIFPLIFGFK